MQHSPTRTGSEEEIDQVSSEEEVEIQTKKKVGRKMK